MTAARSRPNSKRGSGDFRISSCEPKSCRAQGAKKVGLAKQVEQPIHRYHQVLCGSLRLGSATIKALPLATSVLLGVSLQLVKHRIQPSDRTAVRQAKT
jgi:hypothetical protein